MRILILSLCILFSTIVTAEDVCRKHRFSSAEDGLAELRDLRIRNAGVAIHLNHLQTNGIGDGDPDADELGAKLGEGLGKSYTICKCNEALAEQEICIEAIGVMNEITGG